ncbi:MAG TPA: hypothetical protein DCZ10_01465, partial [Pelotomaculum sp.]|nr:hypothetical protein [Pelotomaculum sp.]
MEKPAYARADGIQLNTVQRLYGIIVFPRATLQDIVDNPAFFRGLACLLGLILIFTLAILPKIGAYTIWAMEKQSLHVAAVARDVSVYGAMAAVVLTSLAQPLLFFFVTALLFFLFGYTTKKQASYRVLLAVCVFAYVPVAVAAFLQSVLIMLRPAENLLDVTTSLAMFLPAGEGGVLYKVL